MTNQTEPAIETRSIANAFIIAQEGNIYPCYNAIVGKNRTNPESSKYSLELSFAVTNAQAAQISRALRYVKFHMNSDVMNHFDVKLTGDSNITAGLNAIFKRMQDGSVKSDNTGARPLVSLEMQQHIISKLDGLILTSELAAARLDEEQIAPAALPTYD